MVVKDFLPISNVKITTEKLVKEKPTIEQLTTIEVPGKPVPASFMAREIKKARKKNERKDKTVESVKEKQKVKKDSIFIITEKPQAAQKIADSLGEARKYTEEGVGYYEVERNGEKIIVVSAVGHLFNLTYVKGQKGWPIFDVVWQPSYESKGAEFTKRYYSLIRSLSARAKEFIVATDYDIEGEVIGWNVLRFACNQKTAKRMKFSTLTKEELAKSYDSPEKEINWANAYAGEARHIIDWLYGINLSRALMSAIKKEGVFKILSIGRVQGPALKIIVDREREIANFKSAPYWQVFALVNNRNSEEPKVLEFKHPEDIFEKEKLKKFENIKEAEAETKKTEQKTQPPEPFDLTTLQREAYRLHKFSPSETLSLAQKLYLEGLISYPRTSSQKIPEAIEPKKILKKLSKNFAEVSQATRSSPVEGKKSDPAHPSIYPTGDFKEKEGKEEKLYTLIVKRFISVFCPDLITLNKRIVLTADNLIFTANAQKIKEKGWTAVYPYVIEESDLPDLKGKVKIDEIKFVEKKTQPPSRYSATSLVTILEKKNLGTKSTRSMIVDTLFNRGYLDGKSIGATPLGEKLIEALEKYSSIIIDENLTRQLEDEMLNIQNSKDSFEEKEKAVIEKSKKIIEDIAKEFKEKEGEIGKVLASGLLEFRKEQNEANTLMSCLTCKKGSLRILYSKKTRRYFVACSAYPECKQTFSLPPNSLIKRADKICPADNFPKLLAIRSGKRPWEFCFNPLCPLEREKRDKWQARKQEKENSDKD